MRFHRALLLVASAAALLLPAASASASAVAATELVQQGPKLTGADEFGDGQFGNSVAVSADGNTALIGAPTDATPYFNVLAGAVYVFTRSHGLWSQQGLKLVGNCSSDCAHQGTGQTFGGRFGYSVALSADGNTALVGNYDDDHGRGAAWVFTHSANGWTQQGPKLLGTGQTSTVGWFARSVALSADGDTALIGAPQDDGVQGAAWVFTRSGSTWSQQGAKFTGAGPSGAAPRFGGSVTLSADGNTALIGGERDLTNRGAAWVFTRSGSTWTQGAKLVGNCTVDCEHQGTGEIDQGEFGHSVALSADGGTALIGAHQDRLHSDGAAWVFVRSGSDWTQQGAKLVGDCTASCEHQGTGQVGDNANFGSSVALSGDGTTALIAAAEEDGAGATWVFRRSGGEWGQLRPKIIGHCTAGCAGQGTGEIGDGRFGSGLALSANGDTALIGGDEDNRGIGAVWAFGPPSTPANLAAPVIAGTAQQGLVLTETHGSWAYEPTSFAVQWEDCDIFGEDCVPIAGATGQSYTLAASDVGRTIRVVETAANALGTGQSASSAPTAIVRAPAAQPKPQTITFASLGNKMFGEPDFTVTATASSGLPVAFSAGGNCTIAGATIHLTGAGSCVVAASQAGNAEFQPAPTVSQTFSIAPKAAPTPTPTPPLFGSGGVVQLPSTKRCVSRRHFTIHIRERKGFKIATASVILNGKLLKVVKRKTFRRTRHAADVDLRGLPKGTFKVRIVIVATDGRVVRGTRTYHTCAKRRT